MLTSKLSLLLVYFFLGSGICFCQNTGLSPIPESVCINCDTSINFKLILGNQKSIMKDLDKDFLKHVYKSTIGLVKTFPSLFYKSSNQKEYLKIVSNPGGSESGCSFFEVGYLQNKSKEHYTGKSTEERFITESGIKLGMPYSKFFLLKGSRYKLFSLEGGISLYFYQYGHTTSQTQITFDDPVYIAVYKFKNDRLISFAFGFLPIIPD